MTTTTKSTDVRISRNLHLTVSLFLRSIKDEGRNLEEERARVVRPHHVVERMSNETLPRVVEKEITCIGSIVDGASHFRHAAKLATPVDAEEEQNWTAPLLHSKGLI